MPDIPRLDNGFGLLLAVAVLMVVALLLADWSERRRSR